METTRVFIEQLFWKILQRFPEKTSAVESFFRSMLELTAKTVNGFEDSEIFSTEILQSSFSATASE